MGEREDKYWGTLDPYDEEFAAQACNRFNDHVQSLSEDGTTDRVVRAWCQYHSKDRDDRYDNSELIERGDKGANIEVNLNEFRTLIRHKVAMATGKRLSFKALALNDDSRSLSGALKAQNVLRHYQARGGLKEAWKLAAETSLVMGCAWVSCLWDKTMGQELSADPDTGSFQYQGDVRYRVHTLFDVAYDRSSEDPKDPRWAIIKIKVNRFELAALYPKYEDEILEARVEDRDSFPSQQAESLFYKDDPDYIRPLFVFFRPSVLNPVGRMAIILDKETVIFDGPSSYSRVPAFLMAENFVIGESRMPYGNEHDILPITELMQDAESSLASGHAALTPVLWTPDGTELDMDTLGPFAHIKGGSIKPESINLFGITQESYQYKRELLSTAKRFAMVSDATMGDANAADSGSKLAFQVSTAMEAQKPFTSELSELFGQVATMTIEVLRTHMPEERVVSITGQRGQSEVVAFSQGDLEVVQNVVVMPADPMLDTPEGRKHVADLAAQKGWVNNPDEWITAYLTGASEIITGDNTDHHVLIKRENEQLVGGGPPPVLCETDLHRPHIDSHLTLMFDDAVRRDPQLKQRVQSHILEHLLALSPGTEQFFPQMLAATGQQPLPNMAASTGAPAPTEMQPPNADGLPEAPKGSEPKETGLSGQATPSPASMPGAPNNPGTGQDAPTPALDTAPVPPGAAA